MRPVLTSHSLILPYLFRQLGDTCSTSLQVTSFAYTFVTAGTYVFGLSTDREKITVIQVICRN